MRLFSIICSALLTFLVLAASFGASPTVQPPFKRYLTKIDATGTAGLYFLLGSNILTLKNLQGQTATTFNVEASTLKVNPTVTVAMKNTSGSRIYTSAKQTWALTDESGEGVDITNNTLSTLIIVSMIDRPVNLNLGGSQYKVLGHSFMLINNPSAPGKLVLGSGWTAYYGSITEKLPTILSPTLIEIQPNEAGIINGVPVLSESKIFGQPLTLSGS